ncbi:unnamed protein product [Heligmosomoides polygyrus]|uniref:Uncharacterized protein n=1 Tax=Heligmosomoides polygyrus TaxID=6339 RepID=A0A3P8BPX2_HELPZ|nr:unnamed protein product [Heligmosomoides polygyrus]
MAGQEIKDELYWKAARTYILYKYRKTIMAIGFGLALLTAGGVYYYIKRRENGRPTGRPGTPYRSLEEKDIPQRSPNIDYSAAGAADCCSTLSVSLPRKKSRRWTLDEILEHAPRTGKNSKKREEKSRSGSKPRSRQDSKSKSKSSSSSSGKRSKSPGK